MVVLDPGPLWVLLVTQYAEGLANDLRAHLGAARCLDVTVRAAEARNAVVVTVVPVAQNDANRRIIANMVRVAMKPAWDGPLLHERVSLLVQVGPTELAVAAWEMVS